MNNNKKGLLKNIDDYFAFVLAVASILYLLFSLYNMFVYSQENLLLIVGLALACIIILLLIIYFFVNIITLQEKTKEDDE